MGKKVLCLWAGISARSWLVHAMFPGPNSSFLFNWIAAVTGSSFSREVSRLQLAPKRARESMPKIDGLEAFWCTVLAVASRYLYSLYLVRLIRVASGGLNLSCLRRVNRVYEPFVIIFRLKLFISLWPYLRLVRRVLNVAVVTTSWAWEHTEVLSMA